MWYDTLSVVEFVTNKKMNGHCVCVRDFVIYEKLKGHCVCVRVFVIHKKWKNPMFESGKM